jgi:hypothetical protein
MDPEIMVNLAYGVTQDRQLAGIARRLDSGEAKCINKNLWCIFLKNPPDTSLFPRRRSLKTRGALSRDTHVYVS